MNETSQVGKSHKNSVDLASSHYEISLSALDNEGNQVYNDYSCGIVDVAYFFCKEFHYIVNDVNDIII